MESLHDKTTRNQKIAAVEQAICSCFRASKMLTPEETTDPVIRLISEYRRLHLEFARYCYEYKEDDEGDISVAQAFQGPPLQFVTDGPESVSKSLVHRANGITAALCHLVKICKDVTGADLQFALYTERKREFVTRNFIDRWHHLRLARCYYLVGDGNKGDEYVARAMRGPCEEEDADTEPPTLFDETAASFM